MIAVVVLINKEGFARAKHLMIGNVISQQRICQNSEMIMQRKNSGGKQSNVQLYHCPMIMTESHFLI